MSLTMDNPHSIIIKYNANKLLNIQMQSKRAGNPYLNSMPYILKFCFCFLANDNQVHRYRAAPVPIASIFVHYHNFVF